jgi:hypothetical protein
MNDHLSFEVGIAYFAPGDAIKYSPNFACSSELDTEFGPVPGGCTDSATRLWGQARIDF